MKKKTMAVLLNNKRGSERRSRREGSGAVFGGHCTGCGDKDTRRAGGGGAAARAWFDCVPPHCSATIRSQTDHKQLVSLLMGGGAMAEVHIMRIVAASPGDVQAERDALPDVVEELNDGIARDRGLRLELAR
jgi:hypothetical protein